MKYPINKTLLNPGSYQVHEIPDAFEKVEDIYLEETIEGRTNSHYLYTHYSISSDKTNWSQWKLWNPGSLMGDVLDSRFYLKLKWTLDQNLVNTPLIIRSYELKVKQAEREKPVLDLAFNNTDNMIVEGFNKIGDIVQPVTNTLNYWLNKNLGIDVKYFHIRPKESGVDPHMLVYTQYKEDEAKLMKVILSSGEFPDNKPEITDWGFEFENFEIEIAKDYFEMLFGLNEKPTNGDFIYFCNANRLYSVSSNYLRRGTNEHPTAYVLFLKTFVDDTSIEKNDDTKEMLEEFTLNTDILEQIRNEDKVDTENYQQLSAKTLSQDEVRDEIHENNEIILDTVTNNGSELLRNYYSFIKIPRNDIAVRYLPTVAASNNQSFGYSAWIKLQNNSYFPSFDITSQELTPEGLLKISISRLPQQCGILPETYIRTSANHYYVLDVDGSYLTLRHRSILSISEFNNVGVSKVNNLFMLMQGDNDIRLDLFESQMLKLTFGNFSKQVSLGSPLTKDTWYNITFNINNEHKYVGFYIWKMDAGISHDSTALQNVLKQEITNDFCLSFNTVPMILGSEMNIGNIRFYNRAIGPEDQALVHSSRTLQKPSVAFVIDNCDTIFNNKNIGSPATKSRDPYGDRITEGDKL